MKPAKRFGLTNLHSSITMEGLMAIVGIILILMGYLTIPWKYSCTDNSKYDEKIMENKNTTEKFTTTPTVQHGSERAVGTNENIITAFDYKNDHKCEKHNTQEKCRQDSDCGWCQSSQKGKADHGYCVPGTPAGPSDLTKNCSAGNDRYRNYECMPFRHNEFNYKWKYGGHQQQFKDILQ